MILQKYPLLWIDPSDILVFTAYLGVAEILTEMSLGSIHDEVYFCNIILKTNVPSFAPSFCLFDQHYELQSEFFAIVANVRIG